jgi:hypothetical protein
MQAFTIRCAIQRRGLVHQQRTWLISRTTCQKCLMAVLPAV